MARKKKGNRIDGWLVLDKPQGLTSTAALARVKRLLFPQKAGHGGTLDPLATGLLPIAFGEATKTVSFVMDGRKLYRFAIRWGCETDTDDAEGTVLARSAVRPDADRIRALLPRFRGTISQKPPRFSAIKVNGQRAYDLARGGAATDLAARPVRIDRLSLLHTPDAHTATFEAVCGKGAYIRAIARDLGRELGCYGHICRLRRLQVGPFCEDHMISLEKLQELGDTAAQNETFANHLHPVASALDDIPALPVDRAQASCLRSGQRVLYRGQPITADGPVVAICGGTPVALARLKEGAIVPTRAFNLPL